MEGEPVGNRTKKLKDATQFAILLFATGWGVYTFVYKEAIVPSQRPAALVVTTSLEEIGRSEEAVMIRLRIHAVNRTDRRIYAPALWYDVGAFKFERQAGEAEAFRTQAAGAPHYQCQARFSAVSAYDIVAVGTIYNTGGTFFNPTDEDTTEVLFEVPLDCQYDALQVWSKFFVTKDIEDLELTGWNVAEGGAYEPKLVLRSEPYDPMANPKHLAWAKTAGSGYYDCTSTLSLWPKSGPLHSTESSTNPQVAARPQ